MADSKASEPKQPEADGTLSAVESKMSIEDESNSCRDGKSATREIKIDIIDSANVEKYEKLIRNDKIKSPFKRRLSGEDDDDAEGHAQFCECNCDECSEQSSNLHKKTKTHENDHGRERFRRASTSSGESNRNCPKRVEYEKDPVILARRQKQIDYGKNTLGYENYLEQIPKDKRTKDHPKTPPKHIQYSRRAWDGLIKVWRRQLHCFDPNSNMDDN